VDDYRDAVEREVFWRQWEFGSKLDGSLSWDSYFGTERSLIFRRLGRLGDLGDLGALDMGGKTRHVKAGERCELP
jgi:hypothetical protein